MNQDDHRQRLTELQRQRNLMELQLATERSDYNQNAGLAARWAIKAGLSKVEVAKLLGISRPTLYKILDG